MATLFKRKNLKMIIILNSPLEKYSFNQPFHHSTDGKIADYNTSFVVSYDEQFLNIDFNCADNPNTDDNTLTEHNSPLYNQEVFEVFIGSGVEDSKSYLEVEINPNNAIWIGRISNPSLGERMQSLEEQVEYDTSGIKHEVNHEESAWSGFLRIPWELIGKNDDGNYRINFYRIRSRSSHSEKDWVCDTESCDFVCWKSTMSGKEPAFHRPKQFGVLKIKR